MRKGVRLLIGDGKTTNVWLDSWLSTHPPRPPIRKEGVETNVRYVAELVEEKSKV